MVATTTTIAITTTTTTITTSTTTTTSGKLGQSGPNCVTKLVAACSSLGTAYERRARPLRPFDPPRHHASLAPCSATATHPSPLAVAFAFTSSVLGRRIHTRIRIRARICSPSRRGAVVSVRTAVVEVAYGLRVDPSATVLEAADLLWRQLRRDSLVVAEDPAEVCGVLDRRSSGLVGS